MGISSLTSVVSDPVVLRLEGPVLDLLLHVDHLGVVVLVLDVAVRVVGVIVVHEGRDVEVAGVAISVVEREVGFVTYDEKGAIVTT